MRNDWKKGREEKRREEKRREEKRREEKTEKRREDERREGKRREETMLLQRFSFKRASRSHAKTGLFPMVFRCVFSGRFWKGLFLVFFWFREVLRVPREVTLDTFLDKIKFFCEKLGPLFLHTITAFWLDFQGPAPPGESKKREKTASGN